MGRLFITDERVSRLVERLVSLYLVHGSVGKVCEALDGVSDEKTYPNRVHALMSGKVNVAVNSKTVDVIEVALAKLPEMDAVMTRSHSETMVQIREQCGELKGMSVEEISSTIGVPVAVLRFVVGEIDTATAWLQKVVRDLGDLKGSVMVAQREALVPLLEQTVALGTQYIKMLKGLEES